MLITLNLARIFDEVLILNRVEKLVTARPDYGWLDLLEERHELERLCVLVLNAGSLLDCGSRVRCRSLHILNRLDGTLYFRIGFVGATADPHERLDPDVLPLRVQSRIALPRLQDEVDVVTVEPGDATMLFYQHHRHVRRMLVALPDRDFSVVADFPVVAPIETEAGWVGQDFDHVSCLSC